MLSQLQVVLALFTAEIIDPIDDLPGTPAGGTFELVFQMGKG